MEIARSVLHLSLIAGCLRCRQMVHLTRRYPVLHIHVWTKLSPFRTRHRVLPVHHCSLTSSMLSKHDILSIEGIIAPSNNRPSDRAATDPIHTGRAVDTSNLVRQMSIIGMTPIEPPWTQTTATPTHSNVILRTGADVAGNIGTFHLATTGSRMTRWAEFIKTGLALTCTNRSMRLNWEAGIRMVSTGHWTETTSPGTAILPVLMTRWRFAWAEATLCSPWTVSVLVGRSIAQAISMSTSSSWTDGSLPATRWSQPPILCNTRFRSFCTLPSLLG